MKHVREPSYRDHGRGCLGQTIGIVYGSVGRITMSLFLTAGLARSPTAHMDMSSLHAPSMKMGTAEYHASMRPSQNIIPSGVLGARGAAQMVTNSLKRCFLVGLSIYVNFQRTCHGLVCGDSSEFPVDMLWVGPW